MTREEKIELLEKEKAYMLAHGGDRQAEALTSAIKALKQDPCEDAISKQAMHIELEKWITYGEYKYSNATKYLYDRIDRLPSINPQPKTGHWIDIKQYHFYNDGDIETTELMCSCCKETVEWDVELPHKPYHCENCGAKMVETPESEE